MSAYFDFTTLLAAKLHDVKNELQMVLNDADAMLTQDSNEDLRQQLTKLNRHAHVTSDSFVELLTIYKLKSHHRVAADECWVEDLLKVQKVKIEQQFDATEVNLSVADDLVWFADSMVLGIALYNCMANAARAGAKQLQLSAEIVEGWLQINVADDGPGFTPEVLANLQQKQASSGACSTGLGLYFCYLAAHSHQNAGKEGRVTISNRSPLGGAQVSFYIP